MTKSQFIKEIGLEETNENLEIHKCPFCGGVFGIDSSFIEQVDDAIVCMMCFKNILLAESE